MKFFQPKSRLGHPEIYLFLLSKKHFKDQSIQKKLYLILKKNSLVSRLKPLCSAVHLYRLAQLKHYVLLQTKYLIGRSIPKYIHILFLSSEKVFTVGASAVVFYLNVKFVILDQTDI